MTAPTEPTEPVVENAPTEPAVPEAETERVDELPDWAKEKLSKANREAQNLRTRLREVEPLAQEAIDAREAAKTSEQRALERAQALEAQLVTVQLQAETNGLAAQFGIPPTHVRYIVGNSPEERADAAKGIAELLHAHSTPQPVAPPSNRPVEGLRPGASPTPPSEPPTAYPDWWIQKPRPGAQ